MHFGFMDVFLFHQVEVRECWLSFDTESFVFQVAVQKYNFVVLQGCETWSLTLREECRLRMFENRLMRSVFRKFGPKGDEVTGE
jgi:hypothetical protein